MAFEAYSEFGKTILVSLDATETSPKPVYQKVVLKPTSDGYELETITQVNQRVNQTATDYRHVKLRQSNQGFWAEDLPYQPTQFVSRKLEGLVIYHNASENKYWSIENVDGQLVVFYKNAQTQDRWVCQEVNASKSLIDRCREREEKGYKSFTTANWHPDKGMY